MTFVGEFAFFFGLCISVAFANSYRRNPLLAAFSVFLYFWHTAFSGVYLYISRIMTADSSDYLYLSTLDPPFGTGTQFVIWLMGLLRQLFDSPGRPAADLDYFLLFGIFGYVGLMVLLKSLVEAAGDRYRSLVPLILIMCCLPGLNYWSASIGKDGLVFLGICLVVFASSDFRGRTSWLLLGMGIITVIRPHIAVLLLASYLFQLLITQKLRLWIRITGTILGAIAMYAVWQQLLSLLNITDLNTTVTRDMLSNLLINNVNSSSAVDMQNEPLPLRMLTYLFRPLFWDGRGLTGFVASCENVILVGLFIIPIWGLLGKFGRLVTDPGIAFNLVFFCLATLLLASATSNIGIADRQKTMVLPSGFLVVVWLSQAAIRERRKQPLVHLGRLRFVKPPGGQSDL